MTYNDVDYLRDIRYQIDDDIDIDLACALFAHGGDSAHHRCRGNYNYLESLDKNKQEQIKNEERKYDIENEESYNKYIFLKDNQDNQKNISTMRTNTITTMLALAFLGYIIQKSRKMIKRRSISKVISDKIPEPVLPTKSGTDNSYDETSYYSYWISKEYPLVHEIMRKSKTVKDARMKLVKLSISKDKGKYSLFSFKKKIGSTSKYLIRVNGQLRDSLDEIGRAFLYYFYSSKRSVKHLKNFSLKNFSLKSRSRRQSK